MPRVGTPAPLISSFDGDSRYLFVTDYRQLMFLTVTKKLYAVISAEDKQIAVAEWLGRRTP